MRLDKYLVEKNFFATREKASFAIKKGMVIINDFCIKKTSYLVNVEQDEIKILEEEILKYVSRGGLKLEKAIVDFKLDFTNKNVLDIGSSTGGFTDCALQNGATHVSAVDVGSNQLDAGLRANPKIQLFENTDFRDIKPNQLLHQKYDIILSDVSFISVTKLFPFILSYMDVNTIFVCLIKPQFEAGRNHVGRDGIVKKIEVHLKIIESMARESEIIGLYLQKLSFAPIHFKKKNVEYLAVFSTQKTDQIINPKSVVYEAFKIKSRL